MSAGFWAYAHDSTVGLAGSLGNITITAGDGNIIDILGLSTTQVIAATGILDIDLQDEDLNIAVKYVDLAAAGTNIGTIPRLNDDVNTTTSSLAASSWRGVRLAGSDLALVITPAAGAQNDTLNVRLWGRVKSGPGTVSAAAVAPVTTTITINEVY